MKLNEYETTKFYFGNPIFDTFTVEEIQEHISQLGELEIKAIKPEFVLDFSDGEGKIMKCDKIYVDEHQALKIIKGFPDEMFDLVGVEK